MILPQAEYAYNDLVNKSVGKCPFEFFYGLQPWGVLELKDINVIERKSVEVEKFVVAMKKTHQYVKDHLQRCVDKYKQKVDIERREFISRLEI